MSEKSKPAVSRILVIDDEEGFRALLSHELSKRGYIVSTACNGEDGLDKVRKGKFDLAISDVKMPKMDGLGFLELMKKDNPDIEVIMATGFGTVETAVSAMKKGAYDFVQKPYNLPEVFALIEKALEKRELKTIIGIYEASKAIFSSVKLDKLLPIIMELALKILKADDASIMLAKKDGEMTIEACMGLENDQRKKARLAIGERVAGKAAEWKEPVIISGKLEMDERFSGIPQLRDIQSSILYPIEIEGEFLGVMNVNRTTQEEPFTNRDLCNVTIFGCQIAQAVYNAKLYQELEQKISELRKAYEQLEETQSQLVQSEKLAAIGQLAAGVAHELNNPLTGILGFSQMMLESPALTPEHREDIESIYKQSQRCRQIIQNLLQFSRRREPRQEAARIRPLLEETVQLVKYDFTSAGIEIEMEATPTELPLVWADSSQLQQVFLNLITNARHAMEGKTRAKLTIGFKQDANTVTVTIRDTGSGIKKENIGKIFDPFFTTKPVGKGTGLGLSISYGIVQLHNGLLYAESEEGVGTTFFVELPIHKAG